MFICDSRRRYSVSKRLVKLTRFKSFSLQLSGHQDIPLLSFVRVVSSALIRCGWVFISTRSVENCISVERLNTLITDLQSVLQGSKKICGQPGKVYSLTYSQFCKAAKTLRPVKQGLFSVIPEAAVQINFAVNLARLFRTPISYYIDNHTQNRCSKNSSKIHGKMLLPASLFNKAAGLRPSFLLKRHFSTGVFLWIMKKFQEHLFYRTPLDDCFSNTVQILLH